MGFMHVQKIAYLENSCLVITGKMVKRVLLFWVLRQAGIFPRLLGSNSFCTRWIRYI
jgi:hypothetical protein